MSAQGFRSGEAGPDFDPRLTFDTLVVGPANRLASAAARRAAESPGTSYNPLFLYSASGLGKSHILNAIAHHAVRTHPTRLVEYETLEGYLDYLTRALEVGGSGAALDRYARVEILLLDDVQFLTGQAQAQEMLLRTLDTLTTRGAQVVLASDRPPAEINGLDARLLSRFSGGLIVDMGLPDYETRVAIMRRKVEERKARLADGVAELLARYPFQNVRELQGALNRLLAIQELEERLVPPHELASVLGEQFSAVVAVGEAPGSGVGDAAGAGRAEDRAVPSEPEWKRAFRTVIAAVESAGYSAERIRRLLEIGGNGPPDWQAILLGFRKDMDRLREIRNELQALPAPWPTDAELVLRDPDLLDEAERLLALAVERSRAFPVIPPGPDLAASGSRFPALARRAAERAMETDAPHYNPLFVHAPEAARTRGFLEACGRAYQQQHPKGIVGLLSVPDFSEEFIAALSAGVAGAWRERWWTLDLLLLHEVESLGGTERAQEEFFHLFEALKRKGARIFLAADRPASRLEGIDDRLRSRFQGGLVLDLGPDAAPPAVTAPSAATGSAAPSIHRSPEAPGDRTNGVAVTAERETPAWLPPQDRVVWRWHRIEDRIVEELP
ncbi:MAG: hypothetical protein EA350_05610 [Gemmatimonadales bacterium]|nr:MAG: hypothetical protein EA350_05610 [Gemmatimonadales bacterium]